MLDLALSLDAAAVRASSVAFSPLSLFAGAAAGAWYDPSDIATLWQDSARTTPVTAHGDPVGAIDDKSGNAHHWLQSTAGKLPLYQVSGSEKFLLLDGADDFMTSAWALAFPFDRVSAIRQVTWTANDRIFCSNTSGIMNQGGSTPNLRLLDGIAAVVNSSLAVGTSGVVTERHVANAQQLAVNNGAYVSGDAGATAPASPTTLGAGPAGANAANVRFYGMVMRGTMTDPQIASLRTWLGAKCGVVL